MFTRKLLDVSWNTCILICTKVLYYAKYISQSRIYTIQFNNLIIYVIRKNEESSLFTYKLNIDIMLILKIIEINIWQENSFGLQQLCRIEKNDTAFFCFFEKYISNNTWNSKKCIFVGFPHKWRCVILIDILVVYYVDDKSHSENIYRHHSCNAHKYWWPCFLQYVS